MTYLEILKTTEMLNKISLETKETLPPFLSTYFMLGTILVFTDNP